jgi:hypothetical protein
MRILQIDAWRNSDGWDWNDWFKIGEIDRDEFEELDSNRKLLRWLREAGILSDSSAGKLYIEDDQYNLIICKRGTNRPLLAIEYGVEFV